MRVTKILTACGLREWPSCISQADREFYMNRGSQIHKVTELHDLETLDEATVDDRIKGFLQGWKTFRKQIGGKPLAIEREIKHTTLGYQGRLDRIWSKCAICQYPSVLDIKTNEADIVTRLQLSGYRLPLRMRNLKRMAVSLFEDGTFKAEVYDDDVKDAASWIHCVGLASWLQRHRIDKGE